VSYAAKSAYLSAFHLRGQPDNEADDIPRTQNQPKVAPPEPQVTAVMQGWIDAMNQCDDFDSFVKLDAKLAAETVLRDSLDGWRQQTAIRCLTRSVEASRDMAELAKLAEVIKGQPEAVQRPLRAVYPIKYKALKQVAQA
jgi:DNA-binding phage protein